MAGTTPSLNRSQRYHRTDYYTSTEHFAKSQAVSRNWLAAALFPRSRTADAPGFPLPLELDDRRLRGGPHLPRLGEHTVEVAEEIGYEQEEIAELIETSVLGAP